MKPIDALTAGDMNNIRLYMEMYGGYDGGGTTIASDINYLLRYWNTNKSSFLFELFQEKLIHEKFVEINMPESLVMEAMEEAIWPKEGRLDFTGQFYNWTLNYVDKATNYDTYCDTEGMLWMSNLVNNIYSGPEIKIPVPEKAHPLVIPTGMKLMKAFSKIVKAFPNHFTESAFEQFRINHSMVLNQTKFKGTVGISIHPMDYMTMSDNNYSWDSCMSWQKPGEYRMGTVEMMNSDCVVVAYLRGEKDMNCGCGVTWNNKRWRKLFVVDPDIILGIKGYPYNDKELEQVVFEMLFELGKDITKWIPEVKQYDFEDEESFYSEGKKIRILPIFGVMYDDFYSAHPMARAEVIPEERLIKSSYSDYYSLELYISGPTMCIGCGENISNEDDLNTASLMCDNCSGLVRCESCGESYYEGDLLTLADGAEWCECCVEYYARTCDCCGSIYSRDSVRMVYLEHCDTLLTGEYIEMCNDCAESEYTHKMFGDFGEYHGVFNYKRTVNTRNMTNEGFHIFGFDTEDDILEMRAEIEEYEREEEES